MKILDWIEKFITGNGKSILSRYTRRTVFTVLALLGVLNVLIIFFVAYFHNRSTYEMSKQTVITQARSMENMFETYRNGLYLLRKDFHEGISPEEFLEKCKNTLETFSLPWKYAAVSYPATGESFNTAVGKDSVNFRYKKAFKKLVMEGLDCYVTLPENINNSCFDISIPVYGRGDSVAAVISMAFPSAQIDSLLMSMKSNGFGYTVLGDFEFDFMIYYDNKVIKKSIKELKKAGYEGLDGFLTATNTRRKTVDCIESGYFAPGHMYMKCFISVLPSAEFGLSLNIPAFQMYFVVELLILAFTIVFVTEMIVVRLVIRRVTNSYVIDPLTKIGKFTSDFAQGNMFSDAASEIKSDDEFGEMKKNIEQMQGRITDVVKSIRESTKVIANGNTPLKEAVETLSTDAKVQLDSVNDISLLIEDMTRSIQQNTLNARHTKDTSDGMTVDIENITLASENTLECIKSVIDKIRFIDEITARTDLLAINAAVEAARAGEHGKGFGVVAAEIRKLAEHCIETSTEINESSGWSLKTTTQAVELIQQITPKIQEVADKVARISDACSEQLKMTYAISRAVMQLVSIASNNSRLAELMNEYSEKLSKEITELNITADFFKIDKEKAHTKEDVISLIEQHTTMILSLKSKLMELNEKSDDKPVSGEDHDLLFDSSDVTVNELDTKTKQPETVKKDTDHTPKEGEDVFLSHRSDSYFNNKYKKGADIKLDDDYTEYY